MSFLKKDVNFGLLFIIILLATSVAAIGIYYNQNYSTLSSRYNTQVSSLQKVTQDLLFHKSVLNQTTSDLATKEQDESELNKRYNKLREDKEKVDSENSRLNTDLSNVNTQLLTKTNQLISAQSEIVAQKTQLAELSRQKTTLESKVRSLENRIDACKADPTACT
jgi:chromosome segregation ATPase